MTTQITADAAGTVRLGDLEVPRLGFGAMRLPGPGVWGPPTDRDEAIRTVRRAVELGVRVIDSAWYYGLDVANEVIAAAIRPYPDDLVLITKLGGARADDGTWVSGLTPEALRAGCERDLRVLGIDAVPVVHLRWMGSADAQRQPRGAGNSADAQRQPRGADNSADKSTPISFTEALDVMLDLQAQGKIQRIGLSNVTAEQVSAAQARTPIASVSNHFGPAEQSDAATLDMCAAQGVAYLPFFPLGAGRAVTATGNALGAVAAKHDATPAQVAIAWLLARSPAMLPIPGTSKVAHLEDNVAAASLRLDPDDLAELAAP
jgi:aryl-alcohol dehydrogenase-like predicted oxidoreductase